MDVATVPLHGNKKPFSFVTVVGLMTIAMVVSGGLGCSRSGERASSSESASVDATVYGQLTDLGAVNGSDHVSGWVINNAGHTGGISRTGEVWSRPPSGPLSLVVFPGGNGIGYGQVYGINSNGVIAGHATLMPDGSGEVLGFTAAPGQTAIVRPANLNPGDGRILFTGINDADSLAGTRYLGGDTYRGVRVTGGVNGTSTVLALPAPFEFHPSEALAIGPSLNGQVGEVVGRVQTFEPIGAPTFQDGYVFTQGWGMRRAIRSKPGAPNQWEILQIPAAAQSQWRFLNAAHATNGRQIAGWGVTTSNRCRAFRYTAETDQLIDLGNLDSTQPQADGCHLGGQYSFLEPHAINTAGDVVGKPYYGGAFYYSDALHRMFDLQQFVDPATNATLTSAYGINDQGEIVGDMLVAGSTVLRGFKMKLPTIPLLCNQVTCVASDACHVAGTCDINTGVCSNPPIADNTACTNGNACTTGESCQARVCTGGTPLSCSATEECDGQLGCVARCPVHSNPCMGPPTRDMVAGTCTYAALPDGALCTDGNACTQTDSCLQGVCTGTNPVSCAESSGGGQCETAGVCNPSTGTCVNVPEPDGFACNDGNPCTQTDSCRNGACVGEDPKVCTTSDQCHAAGTCDPGTGQCSNPAVANGTSCDDGSACTVTDTCTAGSCGGESTCATAQMSPEEAEDAVRFDPIGLSMGPDDAEYATGINNSGTVVGYAQNPDGRTWAWIVTPQLVAWPVANTLEGGAKAYGINDAGAVVGEVDPGNNPIGRHSVGTFPNLLTIPHGRPFRQHGGTAGGSAPVDILTSSLYGSVRGINDLGDMVVMLYDVNGKTGARFAPGDPIGSPPALVQIPSSPQFTGVSVGVGIGPGPDAMIVGGAETFEEMNVGPPAAQRNIKMHDAFSYSPTKGFRNLNDIPASRPGNATWKLQVATATNGKQIVGWGSFGSTGNRVCRAFRLTPLPAANPFIQPGTQIPGVPSPPPPRAEATLIDLGTMADHGLGHCNFFGHAPYVPDAINSRGEVVGSVRSTLSPQGGAFLYSDSTGMIDLTEFVRRTHPTAGYSLKTATGINDQGQIVGTFTTPDDTRVRAYRLTLPPKLTSGPYAQFDWSMKPHFPGSDRKLAPAPPGVTCPTTPVCRTSQGNQGCLGLDPSAPPPPPPTPPTSFDPRPCIESLCQPGIVASCRTSCGSAGTETCGTNGHWGSCLTGAEICDGSDNDCDGMTDEDDICTKPQSAFDPTKRGFDVVLDATLSQSPKSPIISYEWQFPADVSPPIASGKTVNVVFPREDTYPVKLTIRAENGTEASETHGVRVKNIVIASMGDSAASGEGVPDVMATPPAPSGTNPGAPATWWNVRCHRSLLSGHALTARAIERADPRTSVTFISRACSGATTEHLISEHYAGIVQVGPRIPDTEGDGDQDLWLRPQIAALRAALGPKQADALLLQVGINDAKFSSVLKECAAVDGTVAIAASPPWECQDTQQFAMSAVERLEGLSYSHLAIAMSSLTSRPSDIYIADYPDPLRTGPSSLCEEVRFVGAVRRGTHGKNGILNFITAGNFFSDDAVLMSWDVQWGAEVFLPALNGAIAFNATERLGWTHVTGLNQKYVGKAICQPQPPRAFVQYHESWKQQGDENGSFHPNYLGHAILASQICPMVARNLGLPIATCAVIP